MPIEIMELVIRATLSEDRAKKAQHPVEKKASQSLDKGALTEEIVQQVLEIIHQQNER